MYKRPNSHLNNIKVAKKRLKDTKAEIKSVQSNGVSQLNNIKHTKRTIDTKAELKCTNVLIVF